MSKVRIYGDTSGYVDIAVPAVAGTTTLNLDKIPQADISGNIAMDTDTLFVDSANNRVGIGTISPLSGFHISDGTNAGSPQNASRKATLMIDAGATASADLQFMVRSGYNSHIFFGDAADSNVGMLWYNHTENSMNFMTNTVTAMTIDPDQKVGINATSPDGKLNVVSTAHNNGAIFDSTGTTQLWLRDTDATSNQRNWGIQVSGGDFNIIRANDDRVSGFVTPIYIQQAPSNSLVINSSGHVGFGHGSPSAPIDVVTNSNVYAAEFTQSNTSNGDGVLISVGSTAAADYALTVRSDAGNTSVLAAKADGKVGIGTFTPDKTLTVKGTSGDVVQAKIIYAGSDGNRSGLILQNTHTGGREYGLYVGNNSTGGGLGNGFGISDNTASTAYRLFINSSGHIGINTTDADRAQLSVYANGGNKPALLVSNADGGLNAFTIRQNRYLTSNGTNWLVDGKEPIAVVSTSSTSTAKFPSNGLVMHNDTTTSNAFSPPIMFGSQSNSGTYNSAYGYIAGRKIGTGVDTNWNTGEVWIDTAGTKHNGNNAYMDNVPAIRVRTTGTVDMPWQAFSQGTFNGAVASNNTGFQMTVASSQGLNYNNHGTHGYGFTATEEGYYMCYATCLYYPGASGYVYFGWCLNGASKHHWHSNHSISSNHDFVSATLQYCNVGDHLSIENVSASIGGIWGGAHSQYYIWKVG